LEKIAKSRFVPPFGEVRGLGATYTVHLWLVGKRVVDFLIELFRQLLQLRRYKQILVKVVLFEGGWVTLSTNFRGGGGRPPTNFSQKTRVPGLSRGVVCMILRNV